MNLKIVFVTLCIGAVVAVSPAQQGRGRMFGNPVQNPSILLQRDDVRDDLQLTDDQKSKLFDLQQGLGDRFREVARTAGDDPEARKKAFENIGKKIVEEVNKILTTGQQTRLKQISIQLAGNTSATSPDVQKDLSLTAAQKAGIDDLSSRQQKAMTEAFDKLRNGELQIQDITDIRKKNDKVLNDEIGKILTQSQKDKLKTLGGKPFTAKEDQGG